MTRDEIIKPEGRDLDAAVADCVMGWTQWIELGVLYWKTDTKELIVMSDWQPSENIADAWQVVEKMVEDGYCPGLLYDDDGHWALAFDGVQSCNFEHSPDDTSTSFFVEKSLWFDTPTEAICRAALLAVST